MESFEDRLKKFGKHIGSASKLAEELGMSAPSLQSYTNGRSKPGYQIISKLHNLGCNINWLLSGKGNMLLNESEFTQKPIRQKSAPAQTDATSSDLSAQIEIIILKARLEEKENFIKMLLEKQDLNLEANINRTA